MGKCPVALLLASREQKPPVDDRMELAVSHGTGGTSLGEVSP